MESRKLIKFGNSSHVISIPNSWLKKHNLNKGDSIFIQENGNDIIISGKLKEPTKNNSSIIISTAGKDDEGLSREIVSAYFNRYSTIIIVGKDLSKRASDISSTIHGLVALEIVEQTSDKIIAKDFLKLEEVSIPEIVRKVDITARSMIQDVKLATKIQNDKELYDKDKNINKLCFLLFKVIRSVIREPRLAKTFNLEPIDLFNYWLLTKNLETMADEAKRASRYLSQMKLNEDAKSDLIKILSDIESAYLDAIKAFYKKDKELAYGVSASKIAILKECDSFFEKHKGALVGNLIEKLRGMTNAIKTISRIVHDR